ncbi:MAG: radical SAM protein [Alphaproteobacteria bacterium]|nr:radical SAM protein [Alphaproteobacteria bacterium]
MERAPSTDPNPAEAGEVPPDRRIRLTEVYASVQGESTHAGKPCVFVRLTGCNLRCTWCDSAFTFTGGVHRDLEEVAQEAHAFGIHTIEVTGGEPLVQKNAPRLMQRLLDLGHEVLLETSGSRDISVVPEGVRTIMDLKPPDSGEVDANLWENVGHLRPHDEVKFVVASRRDYEWSREITRQHGLADRVAAVLFSPAWGLVDPTALADWIVADRLPVRFQLQLHKVLWDPEARGV